MEPLLGREYCLCPGRMLTFDDFVICMERSARMEKFGQRIPPETASRAEALPA